MENIQHNKEEKMYSYSQLQRVLPSRLFSHTGSLIFVKFLGVLPEAPLFSHLCALQQLFQDAQEPVGLPQAEEQGASSRRREEWRKSV